jgi:hypothetical protein
MTYGRVSSDRHGLVDALGMGCARRRPSGCDDGLKNVRTPAVPFWRYRVAGWGPGRQAVRFPSTLSRLAIECSSHDCGPKTRLRGVDMW